ncbi:hypothetical protein [Denitromonas sp.]|uniref:hypothetical protein n=1 Tax=Denitromonas sp. TaxID=2734609 RepID=UPI003A886758
MSNEAKPKRWWQRWHDALRAWMKENARAHARGRPHGCCSAPPPGTGRRHR